MKKRRIFKGMKAFNKSKMRLHRRIKTKLIVTLFALAKTTKRIFKRVNPIFSGVTKKKNKGLKRIKPKKSGTLSFMNKRINQFSKWKKLTIDSFLSILSTRTPRFHQYLLDKSNSYRRGKKEH